MFIVITTGEGEAQSPSVGANKVLVVITAGEGKAQSPSVGERPVNN